MDTTADTTAPLVEQPVVSPVEAAIAAFSASNPAEGKELMEVITSQQKALEERKKQLESLEARGVDREILAAQLQELMARLGSDLSQQYHIDPAASHILSSNPNVVANAAQRVIAACNAKLMSSSAPSVDPPAKRQRRISAPDQPPPAVRSGAEAATSDLLRRALAARFD